MPLTLDVTDRAGAFAITFFERIGGAGLGSQLQPGHEMRQIQQILHDDLRVGAALIQRIHPGQRAAHVAPQHGLEQASEGITLAKPPMPILGERGMVRHRLIELETAEPAVGQFEMDVLVDYGM